MKRYDSYKNSTVGRVGEVPSHWEVKKLKYLARICNGQDHKGVYDENGQFPIIGTGGVFGRANSFLHTGPSVILGRKGTIDKPQFLTEPFWSVDTAYYTDINPATDPKFFFYCCTTINFDLYKYGSAVPSMSQEVLNHIQFAYPPLIEQQAIANFLDDKTSQIDSLIQKKQQMIALLEEEKTAVINEAVTRGLNPDTPMKDSGVDWLGMVPAHWEVKKLKHIATVKSGFALNSAASVGDDSVRLPYLRVANVQDGYLKLDNVTEVEIDRATSQRYMLQVGDLLMNEGGDNDKLGRGCVWHGEIENCLHQNHVFAVRMNEGVNPDWVNSLTMAMYARQYFMLNCKQSTNLASISQTNIKELPVLMPPATEALDILAHIDSQTSRITQTISHIKKEIELMKEYRTALISEAVTGKIDVRDYQPEPTTSTALA